MPEPKPELPAGPSHIFNSSGVYQRQAFRTFSEDSEVRWLPGPNVKPQLFDHSASLLLPPLVEALHWSSNSFSPDGEMVVGVLALQGSFNEHIAALRRLGVKGVEVRKAEQLQDVSCLIIPGGESTTMAKLAEFHNLFPALRDFVKMGKPVWGTCAGLIFLANKVVGQKSGGQELIGGLDCTVHRNFFGSQIQSFEVDLVVPDLASKEGGPETFRGVFIRAPAVLEAGPGVEVLAVYPIPPNSTLIDPLVESQEGEKKVIVAVKQGNLLGTAFHPELTVDSRWHTFFLKMSSEIEEGASNSIITIEGSDLTLDQQQRNDLPIFQ